jgi:hypothetical protein
MAVLRPVTLKCRLMALSIKQIVICLALAAAVFLSAAKSQTFGHHGGAIEWFDGKVTGPIEVTVTRFAFLFPHPQLYGEKKDQNGKTESWSFVIRLTPTGLKELGWTSRSIKPGDTLTVTYNPHKTMPTVAQPVRVLVNGKFLPLEPGDKE